MKLIDTFSNRLQKAMNYSNMKQVDLVQKTGLDKTLINKYLAGLMKAKQDKLTILAEALNVNEVWLMGYDISKERNLKLDKSGKEVVSIPIVNIVKANYNYLSQENIIGYIDVETTLVGNGEDFFALKVKGTSMAPIFIEGDMVIIKKQNNCENNEFALVILNGEEAALKKVRKTDTGIILQPLNPAYEPLMLSNNEIDTIPLIIVGIVKQLKREF